MTSSRPNIEDIMMHDINIKELTKEELSVLALSFFIIAEIESIDHQFPMMHDVNNEDRRK